MRTCGAARSASEYTATVSIPSSRQVRMTRTAISPRLATSTFLMGRGPGPGVMGWTVVKLSEADKPVRRRAEASAADGKPELVEDKGQAATAVGVGGSA